MNPSKLFSCFLLVVLFFVSSLSPGHAEEVPWSMLQRQMQEMQKTIQSLQSTVLSQNEVIQKQSTRIELLETKGVATGQTISAPQSISIPAGAPKLAGLSQGFNPEIGVVGTVQALLTENSEDAEGMDTIALKELELSFAHYVDPYSRLDAIITFNDNLEEQNVDIEEAYYSHWGLPLGFRAQIGKFRAKIGKQNLLHLHALDTADYPLVIQDFFGDEGLASSGARLVHDIPNPFDIPFEVTGEVLRGNNGSSFSGISRRPIFNTHVKTYYEFSKEANIELGWTTMFGDENPPRLVGETEEGEPIYYTPAEGQDRYGVKVFGGDMTFNWFLPEGRAVKWQNEIYFQNRTGRVHENKDPWGFYSLLDFRLSQRFSVGARFDYVEPLDIKDFHERTTAISPYITFWQSEFANFRLQYSHTDPADPGEKSDDAIFLQANFLIGAHKHPVQ